MGTKSFMPNSCQSLAFQCRWKAWFTTNNAKEKRWREGNGAEAKLRKKSNGRRIGSFNQIRPNLKTRSCTIFMCPGTCNETDEKLPMQIYHLSLPKTTKA